MLVVLGGLGGPVLVSWWSVVLVVPVVLVVIVAVYSWWSWGCCGAVLDCGGLGGVVGGPVLVSWWSRRSWW